MTDDLWDGLREQVAQAHAEFVAPEWWAEMDTGDGTPPVVDDEDYAAADAVLAVVRPAVDALTAERGYYERLVTSANSLMAERVAEVASLTADFEQAVKRAIESQNRAIAAEAEVAALREQMADVWDESAEATADWVANNPGPSGIPHDPPTNPYHAALGVTE